MSAKTGMVWTVVVSAWAVSAYAQESMDWQNPPEASISATVVDDHGAPPYVGQGNVPDFDWTTYTKSCCQGPIGGHGPIMTEVYLRTGPSLPVGGGILNNTMETGWHIQGGGRSLFFNPQMTAAWTIDLGVANIYNNGNRPNILFPVFGNLVSLRGLNRTYAFLGFGREWFLIAPANADGANWRVGFDTGGYYGSARADFNATNASGFLRRNDVFGSQYIAVHSDVEIPFGCCTFLTGFRVEYAHTWMDDLLFLQNANIDDVQLLANFGLRF
ncbi:MAG: hypothetical protein KatS3mg105_2315 [Gemmatales bacterium]|nr:MAG: hypothetical protein KatS3mg105_2315 [Gemmatales bacterium]